MKMNMKMHYARVSLLLASLCLAHSLYCAKDKVMDTLKLAINSNNFAQVKLLIENDKSKELDYKKLCEMADKNYTARRNGISMMQSPADAAKFWIGGGLATLAVFTSMGWIGMSFYEPALRSTQRRYPGLTKKHCWLIAGGSALLAAFCSRIALKGYTCESAYHKVKLAKDIKQLIETKQNSTPVPLS